MSVRDYIKAKYSDKEWEEIELDTEIFVIGIESLQSSIAVELRRSMEEQSLGFRDVGKKLGITDSMTSKILNGGNVTFETITKLSILNRKIPRIVWDDPEVKGISSKAK